VTVRSDDWSRVKEIFAAALKLPPDARSSYLAATCGGDDELRAEVERLLDSHDRASRFLGEPPPLISDLASQTMHLEGQRIGAYEVVSRLGAGGMGEVYRARDLKLGRDVAIKILRHVFTRDPERLARFEREARVLAALTHPNIGAIYAVEDPSPGSGPVATPVLVLELIEGDTLAERIVRGNRDSGVAARRGLPMAEALKIAAQIADALEAAHDKGIVHRDLKPANIKITPAGLVKVLDFGLAKAVMGDDASNPDLSRSPTISVHGTREGMVSRLTSARISGPLAAWSTRCWRAVWRSQAQRSRTRSLRFSNASQIGPGYRAPRRRAFGSCSAVASRKTHGSAFVISAKRGSNC
jgi:serine/threonine protein kinase